MSFGRCEVLVDHRQPVRELSRALAVSTADDDLLRFKVFGVDLDAKLVTSIELEGRWFPHTAQFRSTEGWSRGC